MNKKWVPEKGRPPSPARGITPGMLEKAKTPGLERLAKSLGVDLEALALECRMNPHWKAGYNQLLVSRVYAALQSQGSMTSREVRDR